MVIDNPACVYIKYIQNGFWKGMDEYRDAWIRIVSGGIGDAEKL